MRTHDVTNQVPPLVGLDVLRADAALDEANVGLAPGPTFGAGADAFMRLCFARDAGQVAEATARLVAWAQRR